MKIKRVSPVVLSVVLSGVINASDINSYPSYSGFLGVVNTPNASVVKEGEMGLMFTNQTNNMNPNSSIDFRDDAKQENYNINLGVLPNLDMSFRYTYGTIPSTNGQYLSDRSLSFKYRLPFISSDIVDIAIGVQDIGGISNNFGSKYILFSKTLNSLRGTIGYAKGETKASLDGVFGSIEYQIFDWLHLAGEYDTKAFNGVLKGSYDIDIWNQNITIGAMAKTSTDYKKLYMGIFTSTKFENIDDLSTISFEQKDDKNPIFKPVFQIEPSFILIDGSEYGHMDYTLSADIDLSMRLTKGLIGNIQYNIPISRTANFNEGYVFDYRNRNKFDPLIDQALLSQYFGSFSDDYSWMNVLQAGLFDYQLKGVSWQSGLMDSSGDHLLLAKFSYLIDDLYTKIDRYSNTSKRVERLLSYRYYSDYLKSDLKLTVGEFLYGDSGVAISMKRYFGNSTIKFDLANTKHPLRGDNIIGKLTISIPFGTTKRYKNSYFDIKTGYINYERRKTVAFGDRTNYAQPLHLKEVDNDFTLENYYLDRVK